MPYEKILPDLSAHLVELSRRIGSLKFPVRAYLAGGMAVHYHTGYRMSRDVDIQWSHKLAIPRDLQVFEVVNPDDPEDVEVVSMDGAFGDYLGSFHPDWKDDAPEVMRYGDIVLHIISPLDLAVSKIARFTERDREDIEELASLGVFSAEDLRVRGEEALGYYIGDITQIRYNLRDAVEIARKHERDTSHDEDYKP